MQIGGASPCREGGERAMGLAQLGLWQGARRERAASSLVARARVWEVERMPGSAQRGGSVRAERPHVWIMASMRG
eukprot:1843149-Lingulodinium_polyedra.AAC.1